MGDGGVFHTPSTDFSRPVEELEYTCLLKSTLEDMQTMMWICVEKTVFVLVMITTLRWWNTLNHKIPKVRVQRERKRQIGTHFFSKKIISPK